MALIPCPECKKRISETTGSCPKCGYELAPEKVEEAKDKEKKLQAGVAVGCLVPIFFFLVILMCPQKSPTPRGSPTPQAWQQKLWQETPGYNEDAGTDHYKNKYRAAHRVNETAKSNYRQNPSHSNKQAWDNAATKLDHAYLHLERSMNAGSHNMAKQRELEDFTRGVENERR